MSDLDVAASNAADEPNAVVETTDTQAIETPQEQPVSQTNTEALDRAFEQVASDEPKSIQNRKPDGKFAKGKTEVKPQEPTEPVAAAAPQFDVNELAAFGLTKEALAAAAKSDPAFLADAKRRFTELTQGIEKHKPAAESWAKGQKYVEMAQQAGRDVWDVMDQYVHMESTLRNPQTRAQGLAALAQNMGLDPMTMAQELAAAAQGQQYQPAQAQPPLDPNAIESLLDKKLRERDALKHIEEFTKDHPRFDELSDAIGVLLEKNLAKDLPEAYAKAELLIPAQAGVAPAVNTPAATQTPAAKTNTPAVQPAQPDPITKAKANLSITGSPEGGSNPATRKIPGSTGDALDVAFARVGL